MRCAIFPGLAHKRLIRALQTYLHCTGLPLNTSQGLINALFKSCAPITNWLEWSASSITQKRPLQIKIHMIYTWKALKGITSLLMNHKCFKHPNFCSWSEKNWGPVRMLLACMHVCMSWGRGFKLKCALQRHTTLPLGNQYQWDRNMAWSMPSVKHDMYVERRFLIHTNVKLLCLLTVFKQLSLDRVLLSMNAMGPFAHECNINYTMIWIKYMFKCHVQLSWIIKAQIYSVVEYTYFNSSEKARQILFLNVFFPIKCVHFWVHKHFFFMFASKIIFSSF